MVLVLQAAQVCRRGGAGGMFESSQRLHQVLCATPAMEGLPEKLQLKRQNSQVTGAAPCPAKPSTMWMTTAKRCRAAQDLASTACTSCSWCSGKAQKTIVSKAQDCC